MNIQISTYEDYLEITEGTRQRINEIIEMIAKVKNATNEGWCFKHPTHNINPKYGKCNACRIEDGDIVRCKQCEINYHDPKWVMCYECSMGVIEYKK